MRQAPVLRLRISNENSRVIFHTPERVVLVDLLGHVYRFCEAHCSDLRVVREIDCLAHVGGLDNGPIFAEESIVIAQMIRENLVKAAYKRKAWGSLG